MGVTVSNTAPAIHRMFLQYEFWLSVQEISHFVADICIKNSMTNGINTSMRSVAFLAQK